MPREKHLEDDQAVTVTKAQWDEVMSQLAQLRQQGKVEKPKRVTDRVATLRFYEGKAIIGASEVAERLIDGRLTGFVTLKLEDGEEVEMLYRDYVRFLNGSMGEKVKIIDQKATEHVKSYGKVRAINPDPVNVKTWDGGVIDLEVTSVSYLANVEVLEGEHAGQQYTVPTSVLNL